MRYRAYRLFKFNNYNKIINIGMLDKVKRKENKASGRKDKK